MMSVSGERIVMVKSALSNAAKASSSNRGLVGGGRLDCSGLESSAESTKQKKFI